MARPGNLCFLKEGSAIGANKGFAATWNWLVSFVDNLKGDNINIKLDRSSDEHPVIKFEDGAGVGGGSGGGGGNRFHFACSLDQDGVATIGGGAVQVGGYTRFFEGGNIKVGEDELIVCVRVEIASSDIDLVGYASESELASAQNDMGMFIFPIYRFADGQMTVDYRPLPSIGCWEYATGSQDVG